MFLFYNIITYWDFRLFQSIWGFFDGDGLFLDGDWLFLDGDEFFLDGDGFFLDGDWFWLIDGFILYAFFISFCKSATCYFVIK